MNSMDFYEVVKRRRSVRNYKPDPIPEAALKRIWEAVRLAPSACNLQPWRFIALATPKARAKMTNVLQPWALTAPLIVIALGNRYRAWRRDGMSYHEVDVAIAVEHLVLAAAAEGLGSCWICAFNRAAMSKALELSDEWDPVAAIPIGYSNEPATPTPRLSLSEILSVQ